jgi:hypothetical protein
MKTIKGKENDLGQYNYNWRFPDGKGAPGPWDGEERPSG